MGIDILAEGIEAAKEHLITANLDLWKSVPFGAPEYRYMSSTEAAVQFPSQFDAVIASEVLEHVSDWEQLIFDSSKCLKVSSENDLLHLSALAWWSFHCNDSESDSSVVLAWYCCC